MTMDYKEYSVFSQRLSEGSGQQLSAWQENEDPELMHITQQKDDTKATDYVSQVFVGALLEHVLFKFFLITVVVSNCFIIAFQTYPDIAKKYDTVIFVCEHTALAVFICEILLKWFYGFSLFWKNGWNILDFMLTLAVTIMTAIFSHEETKIISILQVIRNVRMFTIMPGFSIIIHAIIQSLPDMSSIFISLGFFMLMFAVIGTTLFSTAVPSVFGNLVSAVYTLFVCITQDGWADINQEFKNEGLLYASSLYFIIFITGGAFFFANLLIAVVATNLETATADCDEACLPISEDNCLFKDRNIIHVEEVAAKTNMTSQQKHWTDTCLDNLTVDVFEQIALVTAAIERNEKACVKTIEELQATVDKAHSLSYNREKEKEVIMRNQMASSLQEDLLNNEIAMGRSGDILSTLITLEKANVIDSSVDTSHMFTSGMVQNRVRQLSASTTKHREQNTAKTDEN